MGETTEEWMRRWWGRIRIPLALVFLVGIVVRNLDELGSGDVRTLVGGAAWIGFWAWLLLRPLPPPVSDPPTAEELRTRSRPMLRASSAWTVVFALLTVWSVLDRGYLRPASLVALAVPLLLLGGSWFGYAKADSIAARAATARR